MPEVSEEDEIGEESLFSARSPSDGAQAQVEHCNGYGNVISHPNEQFWNSQDILWHASGQIKQIRLVES